MAPLPCLLGILILGCLHAVVFVTWVDWKYHPHWLLELVLFFGIAFYMWSVSSSLEEIAKDLRRIADQSGAKPPPEDPQGLIGT